MSKIKRIIEIDEKIVETLKTDCLDFGEIHEVEVAITNGIPYEERSQGEWIKVKEEIMSVDTVTIYKCSECERVIATLPSKLAKYYPFCHCGADMRNTAKPTKEVIDKFGECKCNTCKHNGTWACNNCHCFDKYEGGAE